ncbi:hypothetical protein WJT74_05625 [Sphingomicrobium sp. XHP0239]|uniref:hypothetical protein n=1 Tax=Sphingomicrobium maritimum TaxID=3133972 RepID=UPI0031CC3937
MSNEPIFTRHLPARQGVFEAAPIGFRPQRPPFRRKTGPLTRIGITLTGRAYLPEAHAYARYLEARGHEAHLVTSARHIAEGDVAILFSARDMLDRSIVARRIHEYHSLSIGRLAWLKDRVATSSLIPEPAGLILQDGLSHDRFASRLPSGPPRFRRPMGIDDAIFDCARDPDPEPEFDLVYCGSLERRQGLAETLGALAKRGFTILCVGYVGTGLPIAELERLGVRFAGPSSRDAIPGHLASARAGLNWMPDIAPLNRQESTKMVEYAAAGLPILSNRYPWAEAFAAQEGSGVTWIDRVYRPDDLDGLERPSLDLRPREWFAMLDRLDFTGFIEAAAAR